MIKEGSVVDDERKEIDQLSILRKSQEPPAEKRTVKVQKLINNIISPENVILRIGDTLLLAGNEGVTAEGEGIFQAVVRYHVKKLPEAVANQGRISQG